jgi:cytochrome b subunit of formate dehydrogenase
MATDRLERHGRRARWFHAATYLVTIPTIVTGLWILTGGEGHPSPLAKATGIGDTELHVWLGRALAGLLVVLVVFGHRSILPFLRETFRVDRGDGRWWLRWHAAVFNGRFGRHEGEFDPGQRLANVVIVGGLLVLTATGLVLTTVHGGSVFALMAKIHRWTAIVVTAAIAGHVLVAAGLFPGYRGVWHSMHLGGRVPIPSARRVWPGWTDRAEEQREQGPDRPYHAQAHRDESPGKGRADDDGHGPERARLPRRDASRPR